MMTESPKSSMFCDHLVARSGKVICDCFVDGLIAVLRSEGYDEADEIATIVHDIDNNLAQQRLETIQQIVDKESA